jgi:hypothetical protein
VPLPCALSLSRAWATLAVNLAARRESSPSPAAPLLPATPATITGSGSCGTRSTAPASVRHGALPLHCRVGRATPEAVSVAGWASPLLPVTPLLPSLSDTVVKSGSCDTGSVVPTYACRGPPALRRHAGHRPGLSWWPATHPVVAKSGLNASGPDPHVPGQRGLHLQCSPVGFCLRLVGHRCCRRCLKWRS